MTDNLVRINSIRKNHSHYNSQEINEFMSEIYSDLSCKSQDKIFAHPLSYPLAYPLAEHSDKNLTLSIKSQSKVDFFKQKSQQDPANLEEVFFTTKPQKLSLTISENPKEIRSQINDISQIYLPKVTEHYGVKTLQELQEIDEANRKLLAINGDENSEVKDQKIEKFNQDQSIANQALGVVVDNSLDAKKSSDNPINFNLIAKQFAQSNQLPSPHFGSIKSFSLKRSSTITNRR
ncbi:MAG: hypothetical protein ACKO47_02415 [Alphaproteobacteria bacterium]